VDEWVNEGDSDGDGLLDAFESLVGVDPNNIDTDADEISDESEIGPDGRTLWDMQLDGMPDGGDGSGDGGSGGGGGGGGGGCFVGTAALNRPPKPGIATRL
jgi:hypothetical protein